MSVIPLSRNFKIHSYNPTGFL